MRQVLSSPGVFFGCVIALVAFAFNSILCRLALGEESIDSISFTSVRLLSGAITLFLITLLVSRKKEVMSKLDLSFKWKNLRAAIALFSYALFFSLAYVQLNTATGALILFATVQFCLLGIQFSKAGQLRAIEVFGITLSLIGLLVLLLPDATRPSFSGLLFMVIAGIAWAAFTAFGKSNNSPIHTTAASFILSIPFCFIIQIFFINDIYLEFSGLLLAIISGAFASGCGYAIWYVVVPNISLTLAAVCQLSVPLIAAFGGYFLLDESIGFDLLISGLLILMGIALISFFPEKREA
ncbi:DMT family transporter [Pleionea sediminis]|uniref:DMT family transporter n=1 Tax=Pleionea sediminis TaxID=2569479 RepID=UPI001186B29F|nr:DMT family transporter [Pleionea sediminis]